jgi:hypothetical protein
MRDQKSQFELDDDRRAWSSSWCSTVMQVDWMPIRGERSVAGVCVWSLRGYDQAQMRIYVRWYRDSAYGLRTGRVTLG